MPYRPSHPPSTSDGLLGGAFVVVGFVALILIAAVDLFTSRWPPSSDTTQDKPGSSVTPLQKDESPSTPAFAKEPIDKDPNTLGNTEDSSLLNPNPTDRQVRPQETQPSYPLIPDLDDKDAALGLEESRAEDQDLKQEDSHSADIHEITVPVANDSSQEWVSLSKPDPESLSSVQASDTQLEAPTASFVHEPKGLSSSSQQQEPTLEFSSSTLIDVPTKLHESSTTIGSQDTSSSTPPPSTPELDTHTFDHHNNNTTAAAAALAALAPAVVVVVHEDEQGQTALNPESSAEFGSISNEAAALKTRPSIRSLYDSASQSISRRASGELSGKKKRGGSFIKKSGTLINKVFKNKEHASSGNVNGNGNVNVNNNNGSSSSSNEDGQRRSSSFDITHDASSSADKKKLTSPSRVSLGSIRSISGSIKKKMGKSANGTTANAASKDAIGLSQGSAAGLNAQDEESHLPEHSQVLSSSSINVAGDDDDDDASLLKTMFKVRKPSK